LPENLKEFSMFMLSLIKSRAFKGKIDVHCKVFVLLTPRRRPRSVRSTDSRHADATVNRLHRTITLLVPSYHSYPQHAARRRFSK
jgi:hypothetical protein